MQGMWVYRAALRLYPRDYRAKFGEEMLRTLEAARAGRKSAWFDVRELAGLVWGAAAQWIGHGGKPGPGWAAPGVPANGLPEDLEAAERRVARLVDRMVNAIATHNFVEARAYSFEEQEARAELLRIKAKYGIQGDSGFGLIG